MRLRVRQASFLKKIGWLAKRSPLIAGGWATSTFVLSYGITALLYIPIARFVTPDNYGLYTIATLVSSGLTLVVDATLVRILVRSPGVLDEIAQAVFYLALVCGLAAMLLCGLLGVPMAWLYNQPQLIGLMWLLSPAIIATAFGSVPHALLARDLNFRKKLIPDTVAVIGATLLGLGAAIGGAEIYSLVFYVVSRPIFSTIIAWQLVDWRPHRRLPNRVTLRRLLSFGLPAGGGELVSYARFNIDAFLISIRLGANPLAFYTVAWNTSDRAALFINSFFKEVGYATFARLQSNHAQLRQVFFSAIRLITSVALPIFGGAILIRQDLVLVVLGEKWRGTIALLVPLLILQTFWVIFYPAGSLVLALGHSRLYAACNSLSLVLTISAILIASSIGIESVAWAMLMVVATTSLVFGAMAWYILRPTLADFWQIVKIPVLFALIVLPSIFGVQQLLLTVGVGQIVRLTVCLLVAAASFLLAIKLNWVSLRQDSSILRATLPDENAETAAKSEALHSSAVVGGQ